MPTRYLAAFAVALHAAGALAQGAPRPPIHGVSAVRIANYSAPSVLVEGRAQVDAVVHELNAVRAKAGRRGDTRLACYSTLVLLKAGKPMGTFRVTAEYVVERPVEKGEPIMSFVVGSADLPRIGQLLAEIPPNRCKPPAE